MRTVQIELPGVVASTRKLGPVFVREDVVLRRWRWRLSFRELLDKYSFVSSKVVKS